MNALDIWAAPHLLLTLGVLVAIGISEKPRIQAVWRDQNRQRMLREAERASRR